MVAMILFQVILQPGGGYLKRAVIEMNEVKRTSLRVRLIERLSRLMPN